MNISDKLVKIVKKMGARFSLNGRPMSSEEVLAPTGLLPAIAKRADQLCTLCMGYGLGLSFEETTGSVLGTKVIFDDVTPEVLRLLCITDVLHELVQGTAAGEVTQLDQLLYD